MKNNDQNHRINRRELARQDDGWGDASTPAAPPPISNGIRRKRKKSATVPILLGVAFIIFVLGILVYMFSGSEEGKEGRSMPLQIQKDTMEYPSGARKLEKPILGMTESENTNPLSGLKHAEEFDFTPLDNVPIERIPVLPKKYIKEKEVNEFEQLWENESSNKKHLNISKDQYDIMTLEDLKSISHEYLPRWKANAASAEPINSKSIYALVVNYNPEILPVHALPTGFPLTIAIDGYMPNAQQTVDALKAAGFEVVLNLPLEVDKTRGIKAGVKPITSDISYDNIETRIKWHASSVNGHIGFRNRIDSPALGALEKMNYMMHQIKELGLTFLEVDDPNIDYRSVAYATAETAGLPTRKTSHFLNEIDGDFQKFLRTTVKAGTGIAVINADEKNMRLMAHILEKLKDKREVGLVHLSRIYAFDEMKEVKLVN